MKEKLFRITNSKGYDYFILIARFVLALNFINYGYAKLIDGGQFGVSAQELATPLKDLSTFRVMWYLFDHEPIKSVVGILQIVCGLLLIYNRTVILGVLMFIPIALNIWLMDISFMNESMAKGFTTRFGFYFILCFLILFHYKERVKQMWISATKGVSTKFKFPIWMYLILPILAFFLELSSAVPGVIYYLITQPKEMIQAMKHLWETLMKVF
ncbi:DoxX family membrane protein [uncultured Chryseobacterium sp.]|uniref:DoxX family membrane protein n=1 Tax=uncultured Chryseobacterium sp. TaxID=259322 RepID=UPI0026135F14|nr:DoxX family membrane protein [uncultured Chryseobacterium sp.]